MSVTFEHANAAKDVLLEKLMTTFNSAAGSLVNGIGVGVDADDLYIKVNLTREPTKAEASRLPPKYQGVAVKYDVVGTIRAGL